MKTILFIIAAIVVGIGSAVAYSQYATPDTTPKAEVKSAHESSISPTPTVDPGLPTRIQIPRLGVDAIVEHVAKDAEGRMDVPTGVLNTAWYKLGARPGDAGNAVIAGHLDTPEGNASVFYGLTSLTAGDEIIVTDEDGVSRTFQVTRIETYPDDQFPISTVFGDASGAHLNLITCAGVFDSGADNYSDRTVVFSELMTPDES